MAIPSPLSSSKWNCFPVLMRGREAQTSLAGNKGHWRGKLSVTGELGGTHVHRGHLEGVCVCVCVHVFGDVKKRWGPVG